MSSDDAVAADSWYLDAMNLQLMTGTKASTWRYWATIGQGPPSFRLGRRRVWKRSDVANWLAEQENSVARTDGHNSPECQPIIRKELN